MKKDFTTVTLSGPGLPETDITRLVLPNQERDEFWHGLELTGLGHHGDAWAVPLDFEGADFVPAGKDLQELYHALVSHVTRFYFLEDATVRLLWKAEGGKSKGRVTLGKLQKPSGLLRHYAGADYIVWLAADHCAERNFTNWQVLALLYHELCHAALGEKGEFSTVGHDFEGFVDELATFGAWDESAKAIVAVAQKLPGF